MAELSMYIFMSPQHGCNDYASVITQCFLGFPVSGGSHILFIWPCSICIKAERSPPPPLSQEDNFTCLMTRGSNGNILLKLGLLCTGQNHMKENRLLQRERQVQSFPGTLREFCSLKLLLGCTDSAACTHIGKCCPL